MTEYFMCRKCGKVYFRMDRTGPSLGVMGDVMRHAQTSRCRTCAGVVIWVDDRGRALGSERDDISGAPSALGEIFAGVCMVALWGGIIYGAYRVVMFLAHQFIQK
jgi:hypothetical protein